MKSLRTIAPFAAALLAFGSSSAFALAPCNAITDLGQLVQAGTCYTGINNSVTFSKFQINLPASQLGLVGVQTVYDNVGGTGPVALLGFKFDTSRLNQPGISISFEAQCDQSCLFNDGFNRVQGNAGSGYFWVNGQTYNVASNDGVSPVFSPNVSTVQEYVAFTQTAIPGLSPSTFEMTVNIVQTGMASSGLSQSCPKQ